MQQATMRAGRGRRVELVFLPGDDQDAFARYEQRFLRLGWRDGDELYGLSS